MRFNDAVFGFVLIAFAVAAGLATRGFPQIPGQEYGSALFPRIITIGIGVCGLLLVLSGFRNRAPAVDLDPWARSAKGLATLGLAVGVLVFYILASEWLGFIPTAFIVVSAIMISLRGRWLTSLAYSFAATMVVHKVFSGLLLVPLPWGLLEPLVFGGG